MDRFSWTPSLRNIFRPSSERMPIWELEKIIGKKCFKNSNTESNGPSAVMRKNSILSTWEVLKITHNMESSTVLSRLKGKHKLDRMARVANGSELNSPLLKTIFDRICGRIEYLVDQQLSDVKEKGLPVKVKEIMRWMEDSLTKIGNPTCWGLRGKPISS